VWGGQWTWGPVLGGREGVERMGAVCWRRRGHRRTIGSWECSGWRRNVWRRSWWCAWVSTSGGGGFSRRKRVPRLCVEIGEPTSFTVLHAAPSHLRFPRRSGLRGRGGIAALPEQGVNCDRRKWGRVIEAVRDASHEERRADHQRRICRCLPGSALRRVNLGRDFTGGLGGSNVIAEECKLKDKLSPAAEYRSARILPNFNGAFHTSNTTIYAST